MIRLSSSFFISLFVHALLGLALFYIYNSISPKKETTQDQKLKISLCSLPEKKTTLEKPKNPPKKQVKKIKPKPKTVKKTTQKQKPKKTIPTSLKKEPIIEKVKKLEIPKIAKVEEVVEKKEILEEVPVVQNIETPATVIETKVQKNQRLEQEYISQHIQKITQLLSENLYYPRSARKRNIQGKVIVKFRLSRSAKAYDIEIVSSKNEILSRAARRTIENLSEKFPSPPEELLLHVPITYKLSR